MFCPNCGKPCRDADIFCGSCGYKLPKAAQANPTPAPAAESVAQPAITPAPEERSAPVYNNASVSNYDQTLGTRGDCIDGAILTNSKALAAKLRTDQNVILQLLAAYSRAAASRGICYRIIDAANYVMLNPAYAGRRVSLPSNSTWVDYTALLADYYGFGRTSPVERTCYLFIVGGEDIVPMPVMRHYMAGHANLDDKDIDTDIPYAYMLGGKTFQLLESGKIFEYEQYFHVGRLPFALDASLDDLTGYLRRVAECGGELKINRYYGQTNMPWGEESQVVCTPLRNAELETAAKEYENYYSTFNDQKYDITQGELFYSLPVCQSILDEVFDKSADFYYFNLHGSNKPTATGFYADYVGEAIMPRHIATIDTNNVFVTEACYGGRFQEYRRNESMLLSAMGGKTLLFLGSSRIAFCNNRYSIDNSDRLANIFIEELLSGATAGEALFTARKSFFEYDNGHLYDQQLATIAEFNIFGDPTLKTLSGNATYRASSSRSIVSKSAVQRVCESKCVYDSGNENRPQSVYEQVRQAVDSNLMKIRKVIDQELYEKLGVEPRSLSHIFHNRFADGKEFYSFNYAEEKEDRKELRYAIADKSGKIITVISTK